MPFPTRRLFFSSIAIRETSLPGWPKTAYDWIPETRTFILQVGVCEHPWRLDDKHVGVIVRDASVDDGSSKVPIVKIGTTSVKVIMRTPPTDPVSRAAWYAGFSRRMLSPSIREAMASVEALKEEQKKPGVPEFEPVVITHETFVFVFTKRAEAGTMVLIPYRWAATDATNPLDIWQALRPLACF